MTLETKEDEIIQFLNQMAGCIVWTGKTGKFDIANDNFTKLAGFDSLDELVGATYSEQNCEAGELHDHWMEHDRIVAETGKVIKMICCSGLNGYKDRRLMLGIKTPRLDNQQQFIGTCGQYIDITDDNLFAGVMPLSSNDFNYVGFNQKGAFTYILENNYTNSHENIKLTNRQSEILFFILRGKSASDIADILCKSVRTIEAHIVQLKYKFDCNKRSQLIQRAIALGFLQKVPESILKGKYLQRL